jgi:hypothetical protein
MSPLVDSELEPYQIDICTENSSTDSLFKKIFNVLTMLVMSPIQPRDLGLGKDADCDALIASVQKQDPHGVVLKDVQKPDEPATSGNRESAQRQASAR